jgi:ABC-type spermidine/putrescine transport system permease subunit II
VNRRDVRRLKSDAMTFAVMACVVLAVLPLVLILGTLIARGASSLSMDFFTKMPVPAGESGGGVLNAIVGTLLMVGTASLIGVPLGIASGIYAAEYPGSRLTWVVRFVADVLNGTPSIVIGVFAWTWIVASQKHFSGFAGAAALAILMVPMVMRTTEEMIKLVPHSLREAALALGYSRWRTTLQVVLMTGLPGIVTDGPAPLHRPWQPVPRDAPQRADVRAAPDGVQLRHRPLRGVAPVCVGVGTGADPAGVRAQHRRPRGDEPCRRRPWLRRCATCPGPVPPPRRRRRRRRAWPPTRSRRCTASSPR